MINKFIPLYLAFAAIVLFIIGCQDIEDQFRSNEIISSKGEKIYINALIYGVTGDTQFTGISKNKEFLRSRSDTVTAVKGHDPFLYKFEKDTLMLCFSDTVKSVAEDNFQTIHITYESIPPPAYQKLLTQTIQGGGIYKRILD